MAIPHIMQWTDGAPETFQAGMLVHYTNGYVHLVGHSDNGWAPDHPDLIKRWGWAIKPSELDWASSMANRR